MKRLSSSSLIAIGFMLGTATTVIGASQRGSLVFPDVPSGSYFDEAVGEMYQAGIITGYQNGQFGPNDYVTRGQVAVMMQRFRNDLLGSGGVSSRSSSSRSSSSSSSSSSVSTSRNDNGVFRFTTSGFSVTEDDTEITITVIRSEGNQGAVTVEYEATAGTATAGDDFDLTSGRLSFADEETSRTFTVQINDDSTSESDETITLTLKDPQGGAGLASPSSATITIKDDESGSSGSSSSSTSSVSPNGVLNFNAVEYEILENAGQGTITVARQGGTTGEVSVSYATSNGTAGSSNFASKSGTLTFAAGETTKSFTIDVYDNTSKNGNKTAYLNLSDPTGGAVLGDYKKVDLIIVDDDIGTYGSGSLKFTSNSYDVAEGEGEVTVYVDRLGGAKGTITVDYATASSSAKAGTDFTHTAGKLTFLNGESRKAITIPIKSGDDDSGEESFKVELTNATSGITIDQNYTTVNIQG